jgi:hypothetical protein
MLTQSEFLYLPAGGLGQTPGDDFQLLGKLLAGDAPTGQVVRHLRQVKLAAWNKNDVGVGFLAHLRVGYSDDCHLCHRRMLEQQIFYFLCADLDVPFISSKAKCGVLRFKLPGQSGLTATREADD